MSALAMIPSMKLDKDLLNGENNDTEIRVASGGIGLAMICILPLISISTNNYYLSPCKNCKSKKKLYRMEQLK